MKNKAHSFRLAIAGILAAGVANSALADDKLTIATYGGEWGAAIQDCILTPFTKETGIGITPEPGISAVTLSKLKQQRAAPVLDAVWMDGGMSEVAEKEGVLAPINPDRLDNLGNIIDEAIYRNDKGDIFAVGTGYYSLGIAYNSDDVKTAPTSWLDLWGDDYAGAVTFPSPTNAMGIPFITKIAQLSHASLDKIEPAFEKLRGLDVAAYFDTGGSGTNLFQSGEAIIGAHYASSTHAMHDQGLPIQFVVPKEGAIGGDIRLHLVADTPQAAEAERFINFALGSEPAKCMSERLYVGPTTKGVELSDKAQARMPWGKGGSVANLFLPDWNQINAHRADLIERFNREVANK